MAGNRSRLSVALFAILVTAPGSAAAQAAEGSARAVPTFESLGLYYDRASPVDACPVWYRIAGAAEWREGYPLVYDQRARQYR